MTDKTTPLAIYDFDGTLINGDSIVAYLRSACRAGLLKKSALVMSALRGVLSKTGLIDPQLAKARAMSALAACAAPDRLRAFDLDFAAGLYSRIRQDGLRQLERDRREGYMILLVTASTDNYMVPLAQRLDVDALICTKTDELKNPGSNCRGREKARRVREYLKQNGISPDWARSRAYADSASDLALLSLTGQPFLVCPKRSAVRRSHGQWPILTWR